MAQVQFGITHMLHMVINYDGNYQLNAVSTEPTRDAQPC